MCGSPFSASKYIRDHLHGEHRKRGGTSGQEEVGGEPGKFLLKDEGQYERAIRS